ncbi:rod shape-determining protein MreD [Myxococcota bacterium]|nr:rod shape-determining protein MreD [Myxococcota bacterium]MCZ7620108.1 rod shape-determining protein MreD [Myxococcota bacterium]
MRRTALVAWGLALVGLWIVGSAATWLPRAWLPDVTLLVAVALGLRVPGALGLATAWAVGGTADLLSGGPLGQHALLDLGAWLLTRVGVHRVDLARGVVLVPFVATLSALQLLGQWALTGIPGLGREVFAIAIPQALVNAVVALAFQRLLEGLSGRVDPDDPGPGSLRIDAATGLR